MDVLIFDEDSNCQELPWPHSVRNSAAQDGPRATSNWSGQARPEPGKHGSWAMAWPRLVKINSNRA